MSASRSSVAQDLEPVYGNITPIQLFSDISFVSAEDKRKIQRHCLASACFAIIDPYTQLGSDMYAFHTLLNSDGGKIQKPELAAACGYGVSKQQHLEQLLEQRLFDEFSTLGQHPKRQVRCDVGIIDIVTDTRIVEVKYVLTREALFRAIGQVIAYAACYPWKRIPTVAGCESEYSKRLDMYTSKIGVELLICKP